MKKQNFNDEMLRNEAFQIFNDFTIFESLKISKNILHLIYNNIFLNVENEKDEKTKDEILNILFKLDEIIKNNE